MKRINWKRQWLAVLIFFIFLFFQQFEVVFLTPALNQIRSTFNISYEQMQLVIMLGLWTGAVFFLVWGWLYDRFTRKQPLLYACFVWGVSSLLIGISPTFATFSMSYVISAIDNASYSGLFSMVSDFFPPKHRGKIFGLLHSAQPLAFLGGTLFVNILSSQINWRMVLLILCIVAIFVGVLILFGVKEPKRGESEPEMQGVEVSAIYILDKNGFSGLLKQRGLILLVFAGLFTIMPWTAITTWMFTYLQNVHYLTANEIFRLLLPALTALTLGYPLGGLLGDLLFKYSKKGRVVASIAGISLSMVFLVVSFQMNNARGMGFTLLMMLTGLFMALERPNIIASVFDITLPELRSTAMAIMMVFQLVGSVVAPGIVSLLNPVIGLGPALLWCCIGAWGISLIFLIRLLWFVPKETEVLRQQMAYRSKLEGYLHSMNRG